MAMKPVIPQDVSVPHELKGIFALMDDIESQFHLCLDTPLGQEAMRHALATKGKRIRSRLLACITYSMASPSQKDVATACTALECMHTATLVHDDILDQSPLRRGRSTVYQEYGSNCALLVGDALFATALKTASLLGSRSNIKALLTAAQEMTDGELLQLTNKGSISNLDDYHSIISRKTCSLFVATAKSACVLIGHDDSQPVVQLAKLYGQVFQYVDDILDYSGKAVDLGKEAGVDATVGYATLPLILALQTATLEEQQLVADALTQVTPNADKLCTEVIRRHDGMERAWELVTASLAELRSALECLPSGRWRRLLDQDLDQLEAHTPV